jgi:hypothetical protein
MGSYSRWQSTRACWARKAVVQHEVTHGWTMSTPVLGPDGIQRNQAAVLEVMAQVVFISIHTSSLYFFTVSCKSQCLNRQDHIIELSFICYRGLPRIMFDYARLYLQVGSISKSRLCTPCKKKKSNCYSSFPFPPISTTTLSKAV